MIRGMKKLLAIFPLLAVVALATPRPADAHFSLSVGLPGFGIFVDDPVPPPIVYAPPVYYRPPVVYYHPARVVYPYRHSCHYPGRGHHYGWYRHGRDWDDD